MFKIGEFSKLVRVSARMLRYYEQNGLFMPAQIDRFTSYRFYSASQIPLLLRIAQLRDMGFGVDEIKTLLPQYDHAAVMQQALANKQSEIQGIIAAEQDKLEKIAAMCGLLEKEFISMVYDVQLKSLPAEKVVSLRETVRSAEQETEQWEKLAAFVEKHNVPAELTGYSVYHDDDFREINADIEVALPVAELGNDDGNFKFAQWPALPQVATVQFSGPHMGAYEAMQKIANWIETNGYAMTGIIRGLGIKTYANTASEADFLTEMQVPVVKK